MKTYLTRRYLGTRKREEYETSHYYGYYDTDFVALLNLLKYDRLCTKYGEKYRFNGGNMFCSVCRRYEAGRYIPRTIPVNVIGGKIIVAGEPR